MTGWDGCKVFELLVFMAVPFWHRHFSSRAGELLVDAVFGKRGIDVRVFIA